jgi:hypothetical protein
LRFKQDQPPGRRAYLRRERAEPDRYQPG